MVKLPALAPFLPHRRPHHQYIVGAWISVSVLVAIAPPAAPAISPAPQPTEVFLAEAASVPDSQGQTLVVNGSTASVPWAIVDGQISLADYGLTDYLGATLLSSSQPDRQPIQWFTEPGRPLELAARIQDGYRLLNITPLATSHGWQISSQGDILTITTPPAQILALRREAFPGGERLIIDLSGPAAARLADTDGLTLTLGATIDEAVIREAIAAPAGAYLGSLTALSGAGGSHLQASASHVPQLSTRATPPQIMIDIRADSLRPHSITWATGVRWHQRYISVAGQPFPVYWLEVDPPQASLRPIWPDPTTAVGTAPLTTVARRWQASAAINAGFFNRNNRYPLGAIRTNGEWVSGPILSRGVFGWNDQGQARMERLFLRQALTTSTGQTFPVQTINSGYVQSGIGLYTPAWGSSYQPILESETVVTVIDGVIIAQQPASAIAPGGLPIPANGYLLALRSHATAAQALPPGQSVTLESETLPDSLEPFPHMIGGGPLLIRDRIPVLDARLEQFSAAFATQAAPRSAIGLTASGNFLLVTVHHSPIGPGPTLDQLAQIMLQLNSTDALNLDGGSSSSLYLGGRLINRSPRTTARINNGIGLFLP